MAQKGTTKRKTSKAPAQDPVDESKAVALRAAASPPATLEIPSEMTALMVRSPGQIIDNAIEVSQALNRVLEQRPDLVVAIEKSRYPKLEVWTTLGFLLKGFTNETIRPIITGTTEGKDEAGNTFFLAFAEARTESDKIVGRGEAECNMGEQIYSKTKGGYITRWKERHAARSMAQTRASSKAMRLPLSWIIVLSGLQPTPAEELDEEAMRREREDRAGRKSEPQSKGKPAAAAKGAQATGDHFRDKGPDIERNGKRYEPTIITDKEMIRILEEPADAVDAKGQATIGEEVRRQFIWTAAIKISRGDETARNKYVMIWGSFDGKDKEKVWGPMPWETYRASGELKMRGKWLNRMFHCAKEEYQLWLTGAHPSQAPEPAAEPDKKAAKGKTAGKRAEKKKAPEPAAPPADNIGASIPEAAAVKNAMAKRQFIFAAACEIAQGDVDNAADWIAQWDKDAGSSLPVGNAKTISPRRLDDVYTMAREALIDFRSPLKQGD